MHNFIQALITFLLGINILLDIRAYILIIVIKIKDEYSFKLDKDSFYRNVLLHIICWAIIFILWS